MEDMIQKIVEMDQIAQKLEQDNQEQKEALEKEVKAETAKIYDDYMKKAEKTAEENKAEIEKNAEANWQSQEKHRKEVLENLQKSYEQNGSQWVDQIVKNVLA